MFALKFLFVLACTPSTAEITKIAPSRTRNDRSTSAIKSACPGVSMTFTFTASIKKETTDALIVIPRCLF